MKIGIDTFGCDHGKSGLGSYLLNFIANLPDSSENTFELFGSEEDKYTFNSANGISYVPVALKENSKIERLWHKRKLNAFVKKSGYDAVIFPACEKVITSKVCCKSIIVVNSMLSLELSDEGFRYKNYVKKALNHAYKIIAPTEVIRKDLVKMGVKSKRIKIVRNGIDHKNFFPTVIQEEIVQINPFAIKKPYFLCTTRLSGPDKRHEQLIKAFELFKQKTSLPHRLVIAGEGNEYQKKIHDMAFKSNFASDIFITGYFPQESLPKLYGASEACIFPAINQGAGLPLLEAMACGVPALCSDTGAFAETGEDAVEFFDSDNPDSICSAMIKITSDEAYKNKLIEKGLKKASVYSWEKTVNQTIDSITEK